LIDRCRSQLELAGQLLDDALGDLTGLRIDRQVIELTIGPNELGWRDAVTAADLVVVSHLLTENAGHASKIVTEIAPTLAPHGTALVVEREDDPVWTRLGLETRNLCYPDAELALNGFPGRRDGDHLGLRYLIVNSERSVLHQLVERYFCSWKHQDIGALDGVFAADAVYADKPFSEPIRGLDGIRKYWRSHVLPQREPHPRVLLFTVDGPRAVVEWEVDMLSNGHVKVVKGILVVVLDSSGQRLGSLREYYASTVR
jgi:hypothetical protein